MSKNIPVIIDVPDDSGEIFDAFLSQDPISRYQWIVKGFSDHFTVEMLKELIDRRYIPTKNEICHEI